MLIVSVTGNLLFLATFKYLGFFVTEFAELLERLGFHASISVLEIVLPVGISFYTFQTIGYVVDVYRGKVPATRNFLDYALYVAFFPQLVAGPIERAGHLIPQFQKDRVWSNAAFESGLQLAIWGLFKKVVIADNLAPYVDVVYESPAEFSGAALTHRDRLLCVPDLLRFLRLHRHCARCCAHARLRADAEFRLPVLSKTPVEFWRRWHISLSQWFQDYLYYPLAMRYMRRGGFCQQVQGAHHLDGVDRPLARRQLDLCRVRPLLGCCDRGVSSTAAECFAVAAGSRAKSVERSLEPHPDDHVGAAHVRRRVRRLDPVSRRVFGRRARGVDRLLPAHR